MIVSPIIGTRLRPLLRTCVNQTRNIRPSIKIDKETFQLSLDVRQFDKEEIRVKARNEFIVVEGKQERKTNDGFVIRQFVRKFKLPIGCDPATIKTSLSPNGMLTITAPRSFCEKNLPCERIVPIGHGEDDGGDISLIPPQKSSQPINADPCAHMFEVKKPGPNKSDPIKPVVNPDPSKTNKK